MQHTLMYRIIYGVIPYTIYLQFQSFPVKLFFMTYKSMRFNDKLPGTTDTLNFNLQYLPLERIHYLSLQAISLKKELGSFLWTKNALDLLVLPNKSRAFLRWSKELVG